MSGFTRPERHQTPPFTRATHLGSSKSDLERDSGFSDASSEYLSAVDLTDSEDAGRKGSVIGQDPNGVQVALIGGSYAGLSPMIIMNNFILKQPSQMAPAEKQWGFPPPLDVMPQSQMVLLQPMVSNSSGASPKTGAENARQSKGYMPILKSYPRIAPHPGEVPSKRSGSSRVRSGSSSGYEQRQRRRHHSQRHRSSPGPQPPAQTPSKAIPKLDVASNESAAAAADMEELGDKCLSPLMGFGPLPPYAHDGDAEADAEADALGAGDDFNKLQRFSNTYNILNKCGLLGITMRTKQLIKENKCTQGQVQQLREQTSLLLEALGSGDPQLWTKLQASMQSTDREQHAVKAHRGLM